MLTALKGFFTGLSILTVTILITGTLLVGLIIGGWKAHWWFAQHNADNQAHVIQHGYANQSSLQAEITSDIQQVHQLKLEADNGGNASDIATTQHSILEQICGDAAKLDAPLQGDQGTFITDHCADGVAK